MALSRDIKPSLAFTLGDADSPDVLVAKQLAQQFSIPHVICPVTMTDEELLLDGYTFASRAGFSINIAPYAWLPSVFRKLAPVRSGQVNGLGGECVTGFYYSPLDHLCWSDLASQQWVRARLMARGSLGLLFGGRLGQQLHEDTLSNVLELLRSYPGTWRQRTDMFYLQQRMRNWAGLTLSASAHWYSTRTPLFARDFLHWGRTRTVQERTGRRCQKHLIAHLYPPLAQLPYASDLQAGERSTRIGRMLSAGAKVVRRLRGQNGKNLGADPVITGLAARGELQELLGQLLACDIGIREEAINTMVSRPGEYTRELGILTSAAWANRFLSDN